METQAKFVRRSWSSQTRNLGNFWDQEPSPTERDDTWNEKPRRESGCGRLLGTLSRLRIHSPFAAGKRAGNPPFLRPQILVISIFENTPAALAVQ